MADLQVTCVTKSNNTNESITHVGTYSRKWTKSDAIQSIETGTNTFFTSVYGQRADVRVVQGANGKYLRTYANNQENDNLLELPACL